MTRMILATLLAMLTTTAVAHTADDFALDFDQEGLSIRLYLQAERVDTWDPTCGSRVLAGGERLAMQVQPDYVWLGRWNDEGNYETLVRIERFSTDEGEVDVEYVDSDPNNGHIWIRVNGPGWMQMWRVQGMPRNTFTLRAAPLAPLMPPP